MQQHPLILYTYFRFTSFVVATNINTTPIICANTISSFNTTIPTIKLVIGSSVLNIDVLSAPILTIAL